MREALLEERLFQAFAAGRRKSETLRVGRRVGDAAVGDVFADARTGSGQQLLPEPLGCGVVNVQQRLALGGVGPLFVVRLELGQRQAEALRQLLHGILESDPLVQLEELDDVAAGAAAVAVEEALSRD